MLLTIMVKYLLRSPPEGFEDVVRSHFFYRRDSLIKVDYEYDN